MYNKKSDYAINKRNPDAIVYTDADKNEIKLTRDDFTSEEEFLRWKAWSDAEYKQAEKNDTPSAGSFDTDSFFEAAVRRSLGEDN